MAVELRAKSMRSLNDEFSTGDPVLRAQLTGWMRSEYAHSGKALACNHPVVEARLTERA
jgi:hypothetical protein